MGVWEEILGDVKAIRDRLFNREDVLASELDPVVEKIATVAKDDVKADAPKLEGDVKAVGEDVKADVEGLVHDEAATVEGAATPAPQAAQEPAATPEEGNGDNEPEGEATEAAPSA